MENEKKTTSSSLQIILNLLLIIICCSIFGLFITDYVRKNKELSEFKNEEKARTAKREKLLKQIEGMANMYKDAAMSNVPDEIVPADESSKIKKQIAHDVTVNLSPILSKLPPALDKVDKNQTITQKKLDKVHDKLVRLLNKEIQKSISLRKEMAKALRQERAREDRLQKDLTETRKVVGQLNGLVSELKAKYIAEHEDDSALGDIARTAAAPAKCLKNIITFDWWVARDKRDEQRKYDYIHRSIMEYYHAIGNPKAMKQYMEARQLMIQRRMAIFKKATEKQVQKKQKRSKPSEPEIIK